MWVGIDPIHEDPHPDRIYTLGTFVFDHAQSVVGDGDGITTCGGVDRPMCIRLVAGTYLDPSGAWITWPIDPSLISANAGDAAACLTVPARPATWGAIKAQYR